MLLLSSTAHALIPVPVGGHAGDVDATARVTLERGKVEPNENPASWQKANWELYSVGGGYTYDVRREGNRIVAITWKLEIKPAETGEFVFFDNEEVEHANHLDYRQDAGVGTIEYDFARAVGFGVLLKEDQKREDDRRQ